MKATGIIRRIDELGRIVIPKEMRKSLRIKDGETLEIFVDNDNNIVLKKHSVVKRLEDLSQNLTDSIYSYIKHNIIITDNNNVISISGTNKKDYLNKPISVDIESKINKREDKLEKINVNMQIIQGKDINISYAVNPIIVNGDSVGLIMIYSEKNDLTDLDYKLVQIASKFLTSHLDV